MIKLIAIDLDGTLLNSQKEISSRNKQALKKAKALGVKVVICTGRPLAAIGHYLDELELRDEGDYSITFNGGLVQKNDTGEIIEKTLLSLSDIQNIYQLTKELNVPMDIVSDSDVFQLETSNQYRSFYSEINKLLTYHSSDIHQLTQDHIFNKVVVSMDEEKLDQTISEIPKKWFSAFEIIKTRSDLVEFMPKGVTKASGISLLTKDLKLSASNVMTLGDEENDLPMIEYAGLGVAMANAIDRVKACSDDITDTNDQDGVAKAIEKHVLVKIEEGV